MTNSLPVTGKHSPSGATSAGGEEESVPGSRAAPSRTRGRPRKDQVSTIGEDIRRIAMRLFGERGYIGTSMDTVAAEAGISKRTLYARYPDKISLFRDVLDQVLETYKNPEPAAFPNVRACLLFHTENHFVIRTDPALRSFHNVADMAVQHLPEMAALSQHLTYELGIRRIGESIARTASQSGEAVADPEFVASAIVDLASGHFTRVEALRLRSDFASYKQAAERIVHLLMVAISARAV